MNAIGTFDRLVNSFSFLCKNANSKIDLPLKTEVRSSVTKTNNFFMDSIIIVGRKKKDYIQNKNISKLFQTENMKSK
jgi:hypothetical protein